MQEFQLRVISLQNKEFALELYQCAYKSVGAKKRPSARRIGKIKGNCLLLIRQAIYQVLKANKYDPKTLSHQRSTHYILTEESGVSLALVFQAVQPLKKEEKIVRIQEGVMGMSNEEAHYWFAKISQGKRNSALRAMRILLGE